MLGRAAQSRCEPGHTVLKVISLENDKPNFMKSQMPMCLIPAVFLHSLRDKLYKEEK